ncbi:MAG: putative baseplate assembly protein, partial [Gemmatimonadetes bacterium]|nr:putative baseplate assembly protein [Gemmatimonadota bacterium]
MEVDRAGDFSTYLLRVVSSTAGEDPPPGFDPLLSEVAFSFKAGCPSDFDCRLVRICPPVRLPEPAIDYLAKDYASFRRLLLDRLAVTLPEWRERNVADVGIALVELLAYAGDHVSYHQDAIAGEAYLMTARRRTSVRRHVRLLDYSMHDGVCARAWVALEVDGSGDGVVLPGPSMLETGTFADSPGTRFLTRALDLPPTIDFAQAETATRAGAESFEALHDLTLRSAWSEIQFYTWGDEDCCLPRGATRAYLRNAGDVLAELEPGTVLIFEEVRGEESGRVVDRDPSHRHAVRLTEVRFLEDPLFPDDPAGNAGSPRLRVAEVEWMEADALPFPLCLRDVIDPAQPA